MPELIPSLVTNNVDLRFICHRVTHQMIIILEVNKCRYALVDISWFLNYLNLSYKNSCNKEQCLAKFVSSRC